MHTLVFADIVDSTAKVQQLGDAAAAALWAEHDRHARQALSRLGGREIDRSDGFLMLFDSLPAGVAFALAYHALLGTLGLTARVGVHEGPVTLRSNSPDEIARGARPLEVDGLAKPMAARVMSLAASGRTLLSAAAARALQHTVPAGYELRSHGHYRLKGIDEPAELFELGADGAAFTPPADGDKAYRVVHEDGLWRPRAQVPNNLGPERDGFVGRATELRELASRVGGTQRLLTVLGVGGTGKTRLVRRYGRAWLGDWPDGVFFCDLTEARSVQGVCFAVAAALGVPLGRDDAVAQLGHAIAARGRCLLILDNFEQVVEHAPATLGRWLDRSERAAFVVTSRERLRLAGEAVLALEPMATATDAVELFVTRAREQVAEQAFDAAARADVVRIVEVLDGLPLAIELAAARMRVLSTAQIRQRLSDRFKLLAQARGAAARQATLKAAIDWSWELLTAWEQAALAQCSVFDGGFTMEAAESVLDLSAWPAAPPVLDVVQSLVDKSLLRAWLPKSRPRLAIDEPYFGMYISIHEYAASRLAAGGAQVLDEAQWRHGRCYAQLGQDSFIRALWSADGPRHQQQLTLEADNLATACRRGVLRGDAAVAVACWRALWEVLILRGPVMLGVELGFQVVGMAGLDAGQRIDAEVCLSDAFLRAGRLPEGHERLLRLEREVPAPDSRRAAMVQAQLASLEREQGHMDAALLHGNRALALYQQAGWAHGEGATLHNLGNLHDMLGQPERSRDNHEAAIRVYGQLGHRHGIGHVHSSLGILNRHQGRLKDAHAMYQAALAVYREVGDRRCEGVALGNLGNVLLDEGELDSAAGHFEAALTIHREVGSRVLQAYVMANLALVFQQQGRVAEARTLLDDALVIDREVGNRLHESFTLMSAGMLEAESGSAALAESLIRAALKLQREYRNPLYEGVSLSALGGLYTRQGRLAEAQAAFDEGEALLRQVDNPIELAGLLCGRARLARALGDAAAAEGCIAQAEAIATRTGVKPGSSLAEELAVLRRGVN